MVDALDGDVVPNTTGVKKLEDPHSFKSNEMTRAACETRRRTRILANAHGFKSVHWESVSVEMHHQRVDQA